MPVSSSFCVPLLVYFFSKGIDHRFLYDIITSIYLDSSSNYEKSVLGDQG